MQPLDCSKHMSSAPISRKEDRWDRQTQDGLMIVSDLDGTLLPPPTKVDGHVVHPTMAEGRGGRAIAPQRLANEGRRQVHAPESILFTNCGPRVFGMCFAAF